jgi:hypothetical protein
MRGCRLVQGLIGPMALLALVLAPASASAMNVPPPPGGPEYSYVALGDSYGSGEGLSPFQGGSDTSSDQCHRSLRSYPFLVHNEFATGTFHDYACSGATTDKISANTQYAPELLPQALHGPLSHAQLVTVTVGGDDLGFGSDLAYCFKHTYCQRDASFTERVNGDFAALPANLDAAYDAIRRHKRKHATVIVVGYPRIFPTIQSHQQCQILHGHFGYGYEDSEQDYFNQKAVQLDRAVRAAAKRAGFIYISPTKAFLGHAPCDPNPWLNGVSIQSDGRFTTKASFHPNTEGQREYATLLESGIADHHGPHNPDGLPRDPKPTRHLPPPQHPCVADHPC